MEGLPLYLYYGLFLLLSLHGLHRALLVRRIAAQKLHGPDPEPSPNTEPGTEPMVTVQLPLFNERYVADRLLVAVARFDWPKDRLEIQVLDDSTDDTTRIVARKVHDLRGEGFDVHHIRRPDRHGFKAGALAFGLAGDEHHPPAKGEFVAVFDADFLPEPDFLRRAIPPLVRDPQLAVVQGRWAHLNREHSLLTRVQAVCLDAHFGVEHAARQAAGHFLNFNGTAGVWRRTAIAEAGGWSHDTLTEDLDLSFRSQMTGSRFRYLHDLGVPSELPVEMNAFKSQQYRWVKGAIETAGKLLVPLLRHKGLRLSTRLEGAFHLTNNVAYVLILLVSCLSVPVATLRGTDLDPRVTGWVDLYLISLGILPVAAYFLLGQLRVGRGFWRSVLVLPATLAIGIGLSLNNARAVVSALLGRRSPFVRTPKYRVDTAHDSWIGKDYLASKELWSVLEVALGTWVAVAVIRALSAGNWSMAAYLTLFGSGFLYVGLASLLPAFAERVRAVIVRVTAKVDPRHHNPLT